MDERRELWIHLSLLTAFAVVLAWSAWQPRDPFIWGLEIFPALIGLAVLAATYRRFRLTTFCYVAILLHAVVLLIGGHYTYAEMPLFEWLQDEWALARNHYDRFGHLAQGFFPAVVTRELLLRLTPLRAGGWLFFLVCCVCLSISALYELVEWWVALATGTAADAFLATQGDAWDTQWDMLLALTGAVAAQLLLARPHDCALAALEQPRPDDHSAARHGL